MTGRTLVEDAIQCGGTNPNIGVNCMRVVCTHSRVGFRRESIMSMRVNGIAEHSHADDSRY